MFTHKCQNLKIDITASGCKYPVQWVYCNQSEKSLHNAVVCYYSTNRKSSNDTPNNLYIISSIIFTLLNAPLQRNTKEESSVVSITELPACPTILGYTR